MARAARGRRWGAAPSLQGRLVGVVGALAVLFCGGGVGGWLGRDWGAWVVSPGLAAFGAQTLAARTAGRCSASARRHRWSSGGSSSTVKAVRQPMSPASSPNSRTLHAARVQSSSTAVLGGGREGSRGREGCCFVEGTSVWVLLVDGAAQGRSSKIRVLRGGHEGRAGKPGRGRFMVGASMWVRRQLGGAGAQQQEGSPAGGRGRRERGGK